MKLAHAPFPKIVITAALLFLFAAQVELTGRDVKGWYNKRRAKDLAGSLAWLKSKTAPDEIILTPWTLGMQVVAHAGRRVLATSKVYPSDAAAIAERYKDIARFFFARSEDEAMEIVKKYGVGYVLVPKAFDVWTARYIGRADLTKDGKGKALTERARLETMAGRMLALKPFTHFKPAYIGDYYFIYKVELLS